MRVVGWTYSTQMAKGKIQKNDYTEYKKEETITRKTRKKNRKQEQLQENEARVTNKQTENKDITRSKDIYFPTSIVAKEKTP